MHRYRSIVPFGGHVSSSRQKHDFTFISSPISNSNLYAGNPLSFILCENLKPSDRQIAGSNAKAADKKKEKNIQAVEIAKI